MFLRPTNAISAKDIDRRPELALSKRRYGLNDGVSVAHLWYAVYLILHGLFSNDLCQLVAYACDLVNYCI